MVEINGIALAIWLILTMLLHLFCLRQLNRREQLENAILEHWRKTCLDPCWENDVELWRVIDRELTWPHGCYDSEGGCFRK